MRYADENVCDCCGQHWGGLEPKILPDGRDWCRDCDPTKGQLRLPLDNP